MMKRRYMTGIEIVVCVLLVGVLGSGTFNFTQKRRIKKLTAENVEQATEIKNLVQEVKQINNKKDAIVEQKEKVEDEIKDKASEGFSILYEQAKDIKAEHPSTFTQAHFDTAKAYVEVWGYKAIAGVIKWQHEQIQKQIEETKKAMERESQLRHEYLLYKDQTSKKLRDTQAKANEHEEMAKGLKNKVENFMSNLDSMTSLRNWLIAVIVVSVFVYFGGLKYVKKKLNDKIFEKDEEVKKYRRKKNKMVRAMKTFVSVDEHGNETMERVTKAQGIDLAEEDDDDD